MALLPSVGTKISVELTRYRSAVSEFLAQTLGKSINYLLDREDTISTTLNAASVSEISSVSVGTLPYTVPATYTFSGVLFARHTGANTTFEITISSGNFSGATYHSAGQTSGGGRHWFSVPQVVSAGGVIDATATTGTGSVEFYVRGIIFKTASLAVP